MARWEQSVAFRYLAMARRRGHTAFLTIISTLGLAVGVATLLISLALLSGLQGQIKERLRANSPQILIEPIGSNALENAAPLVRLIEATPGADATTLVSGIAWASDPDGSRGRPVRIRSYDRGDEPEADHSFGRTWQSEEAEGESSIFLSRDFANAMGLFLGDEIVIVAPRQRLTPFGPAPVYRTFRITRILAPSTEDVAPEARIGFEEAASLFGTAGAPTAIEARMAEDLVEPVRAKVEAAGGRLAIRDWTQINKPLFLALRLEKIVMFATISLIIFVAALNLVSSVAMLIVEKRPQVGVLRTLGATERSILEIYLATGLLIGIGGTILGNLIGLGASWAANRFELVPLPRDVYSISHLPFVIEWPEVIGVNVIALVLSVLATWYPARLAARLDPINAISER